VWNPLAAGAPGERLPGAAVDGRGGAKTARAGERARRARSLARGPGLERTRTDSHTSHEPPPHGPLAGALAPADPRSMGPKRARWPRLNTDDKWWPPERWAQLCQRIHEQRRDAVLILRGSREEVPLLEEIRAAARVANVVVVGNSLRELFALAEAASSMISVDTGPAHAAAALSVPLVVLYGAEMPSQWLPRSPFGTPVVGLGGPPVSARADQISVDEVFTALRSLGERRPP